MKVKELMERLKIVTETEAVDKDDEVVFIYGNDKTIYVNNILAPSVEVEKLDIDGRIMNLAFASNNPLDNACLDYKEKREMENWIKNRKVKSVDIEIVKNEE